MCAIVGEACSKFCYGIKASQDRVSRLTLSIPVTSTGNPDYDFMEQYIRERENQIIAGLQGALNQMMR